MLRTFQAAYEAEIQANLATNMDILWEEYMKGHMSMVVDWASWWINDRFDNAYETRWDNQCSQSTQLGAGAQYFDCAMLTLVRRYRNQAADRPSFDSSIFD